MNGVSSVGVKGRVGTNVGVGVNVGGSGVNVKVGMRVGVSCNVGGVRSSFIASWVWPAITVPATAVLISFSFDGKMDGVAQAMLATNSTMAGKRVFLKNDMILSFYEIKQRLLNLTFNLLRLFRFSGSASLLPAIFYACRS